LNDTLVCGAQLIMPRSLASDAPARKRQTCYERRRTQALARLPSCTTNPCGLVVS
jgi:hypothetical protein